MGTQSGEPWDQSLWVKAQVTERKRWAPHLCTLRFAQIRLDFRPGQFTQLGLMIGGQPRIRSFSFANAPKAPLEIYLSLVPGGEVSPHLLSCQPGAHLWVRRQPLGHFGLSESSPPCRNLYLVSTGTGLAPYLSMLRDRRILTAADRIFLIHGARTVSEVPYLQELFEHQAGAQVPFQIGLALSQMDADAVPEWTEPGALINPISALHGGQVWPGRLTTLFEGGAIESQKSFCPLDPDQDRVLLCGRAQMVRAMRIWLRDARGFSRSSPHQPGGYLAEAY